MSKLTGPLKWHGGKHYLAPWIHSLAPPHKHRVYLYAGGLGEAWNWPCEGVSECANDRHGYLCNFYRVLRGRDTFADFMRCVSAIPFSRDEWRAADGTMCEQLENTLAERFNPPWPHVGLAVAFFVWNRQSHAGRMQNFTPLTRKRTRGGRNAEVNAWWSCIEGLPEVRERLDCMVIEHDDALRVLDREDTPETLFYADPPYLIGSSSEGRATADVYECEADVAHHVALAERLARGVLGKVMLSGYRNEIYDGLLTADRGWKRHEREVDNKASGAKVKRVMVECLWCNF